MFRASLRLRAINIGQDRYKRTYWVLPLTGGVYVEGMESGVPEDYIKAGQVQVDTKTDQSGDIKVEVKEEKQEGGEVESRVSCNTEISAVADRKKETREEVSPVDDSVSCEKQTVGEGVSIANKADSDKCESVLNVSDLVREHISKTENSVLKGDNCISKEDKSVVSEVSSCPSESGRDMEESEELDCEMEDEEDIPAAQNVNIELRDKVIDNNNIGITSLKLDQLGLPGAKVCPALDDVKTGDATDIFINHFNAVGPTHLAPWPHIKFCANTNSSVSESEKELACRAESVSAMPVKHENGSQLIDRIKKFIPTIVPPSGKDESGPPTHKYLSSNGCDGGQAPALPDDLSQNGILKKSTEPLDKPGCRTSDILKVPKVGMSQRKGAASQPGAAQLDLSMGQPKRETLVALLNHSIHQAYKCDDPEDLPLKDSTSAVVPAAPSAPSLLTSSLLFSAIPKLPHLTHSKGPEPISISASVPIDFTAKSKLSTGSSILASTPIPAHTKPINPQPLPPFHPSAQASPLLDLTPPAAHAGHKSNKPSTLPPLSVGPAPSPHLPQPPFIPGLTHHPYGPSSASETLSSLASIVSPPPAHNNPITTSAISAPLLTSTPILPRSNSNVSKTRSTYPKVDSILKGEATYSSSELLQQAASQVLRSAETKKQLPATSSEPDKGQQLAADQGNKPSSEVVDHKVWFSLLPRMPCDEFSLTQPIHGQPSPQSSHYQLSSSAISVSASSSLSALSSYLSSPTAANFDNLLPLIQSNPSILSQDPLFTSLQLLTSQVTPSVSPTPCSTPGLDSAGEFKVPPPPDMAFQSDPWDILRAAQGEAQPIPKSK